MSKFFASLVIFTLTLMIATLSLSLPTSKVSGELNSSELESDTPHGKLISNKSVLTYYWVASEADQNSTEKVEIKNCKKETIATVNRDFAIEMKTEGSGISKSGDVFNFDDCSCGKDDFNCFVELDKKKFPFGLSANGNALRPFITIAADDLPEGKLLYIPALRNLTLPDGKHHNGCVKVEDTGKFGGKHIDWFVANESIYKDLDNQKEISNVQIFDGASSDGKTCSLQTYVV